MGSSRMTKLSSQEFAAIYRRAMATGAGALQSHRKLSQVEHDRISLISHALALQGITYYDGQWSRVDAVRRARQITGHTEGCGFDTDTPCDECELVVREGLALIWAVAG